MDWDRWGHSVTTVKILESSDNRTSIEGPSLDEPVVRFVGGLGDRERTSGGVA